MKIIIAPQALKGSLEAPDVARAIGQGLQRVWPQAEYILLPVLRPRPSRSLPNGFAQSAAEAVRARPSPTPAGSATRPCPSPHPAGRPRYGLTY